SASGRTPGASPRNLREARDARQDRQPSCPTADDLHTYSGLDRFRPGGSALSQGRVFACRIARQRISRESLCAMGLVMLMEDTDTTLLGSRRAQRRVSLSIE